MALTIRNSKAERLARKLAKQTGESVTEAIRRAVEDRLRRVKGRRVDRSSDMPTDRFPILRYRIETLTPGRRFLAYLE